MSATWVDGRKPCSACGMVLPPEAFYCDRHRKDGLTCQCRNCVGQAQAAKWRARREAHDRTILDRVHGTPEDIAWAAGFFDGEGYLGIGRAGGSAFGIQVQASQKARKPLEKLTRIFGCGFIVYKPSSGVHVWNTAHRQGAMVLRLIMPHLTIKRRQADWLLRFHAHRDRVHYCGGRPKPKYVRQREQAYARAMVDLRAYSYTEAA